MAQLGQFRCPGTAFLHRFRLLRITSPTPDRRVWIECMHYALWRGRRFAPAERPAWPSQPSDAIASSGRSWPSGAGLGDWDA